jgi:CubicO group peptidase (beta-lactamase class C family)
MADDDKFSGTILVHKKGDVVFENAYGLACKRFNVPNTIETKFNIGSLNKLITKISILQLLQKCFLDLDDYVGKYLPDFPIDIASKVKVRHLISFESGLGDYFNDKFPKVIGQLRKLDDFVDLFIDDPLLFEPGEKQHYSNAGYVVLGKIIEAITGIEYYDYVRENIYKPAGMNDSDHFELDFPTPNLATGYTQHTHSNQDGTNQLKIRRNNFYVIGTKGSLAGGGYSTVRGMMRFDQAIDKEVLLDSKHSNMVMRPLGANPDSKPKSAILAGGAPGLSGLYFKYFESGYTVFILSNYDPEDSEPLVKPIRGVFMPDEDVGRIVTMRKDEK